MNFKQVATASAIKKRQTKSPALVKERDWVAKQLARAPKLTKSRQAKIRQLLVG